MSGTRVRNLPKGFVFLRLYPVRASTLKDKEPWLSPLRGSCGTFFITIAG
jgi:hypothetical protein